MRGSNFHTLIKDELVNRFEDLIKNQLNDYINSKKDIEIRFNRIEIENLEFIQSIKNLKEEIKSKYQDTIDNFIHEKDKLETSFEDQRKFIRKALNEVKSHIENTNEKISDFLSISEFEKIIKKIQSEIVSLKVIINEEKYKKEQDLFNLKNEVEGFIDKKGKSILLSVNNLTEKIDSYKSKIAEFTVNNDGFLKELACCKKNAFIQEKKIENLYTQIERLKAGTS